MAEFLDNDSIYILTSNYGYLLESMKVSNLCMETLTINPLADGLH